MRRRSLAPLLVSLLLLLLPVAGDPWLARATQSEPTLVPTATPRAAQAPSPRPPAGPGTPPVTALPTPPSLALPTPPATALPQDPPELRALWVDAFHDGFKTPAQVDELVDWARRANLNALFVQVRRRGDAYYARSAEPRSEDPDLAPGFDALQYLIERARQGPQRLQVHAWLATLAVWHHRDTPPADPAHVLNLHGLGADPADTWLMLRDDGLAWAGSSSSGTYYLDPGHPAAARYTAEVYLNVLRSYDVDGIHLDQARYFEGSGRDRRWGYNPTSLARFAALGGRDPAAVPEPADAEWAAWRRDQVTALVRRVYLEAKALKPWVAVSAAVVTWDRGPRESADWERSAAFGAVFQDWRYWLQEGIVDYVLPMDYYREVDPQTAWFDTWLSWQHAHRGRRGVVPGVAAYLNQPQQTVAQLSRARALSPLGVALYSYAAPTAGADEDAAAAREALLGPLRGLFARPAPPPELPWLTRPASGSLLVDLPGWENALLAVDGPLRQQWRTDGSGLAGAVELPPGRYSVAALVPGVDPAPVDVLVQAGRTSALRFGSGSASP